MPPSPDFTFARLQPQSSEQRLQFGDLDFVVTAAVTEAGPEPGMVYDLESPGGDRGISIQISALNLEARLVGNPVLFLTSITVVGDLSLSENQVLSLYLQAIEWMKSLATTYDLAGFVHRDFYLPEDDDRDSGVRTSLFHSQSEFASAMQQLDYTPLKRGSGWQKIYQLHSLPEA